MMAREWFSAADLAQLALPGFPRTDRAIQIMAARENWNRVEWEGRYWRLRTASGGGIEYHYAVLPAEPQAALVLHHGHVDTAREREVARARMTREDLWAWFDGLPAKKRDEAKRRLKALDDVEALRAVGVPKTVAAMQVAAAAKVALSGLYRWEGDVRGIDRHDWLPHLAPRHAGRAGDAECSPEAWEYLKSDYLRPEKPNLIDCYRRVVEVAAARGWTVPSRQTLTRRIEALSPQLRVLAREGAEALKRMYPAQQRDRGVFHALEAVNADGHKWDVFVRWPGEKLPVRPVMIAFQDLYSGMILSWRMALTENQEATRLAFGDMVEEFGIPEHCWLDNGRNFTAKWLTAGVRNRFRFKVREEEPSGLMPAVGVNVHFTTPYSGQSKPIERAFRDMAQGIAKHPAFAGCYVGNNPMAKPENYGKAAVDLDVFLRVVGEGIREHNERVGRTSRVCGGTLSFRQAFDVSYAQSPIRKATAEQRRMWLLAAEHVQVRQNGQIEIMGNSYWSDALYRLRGQKVVVRFDPQSLHEPVHVYRGDEGYLGAAECVMAAGFADVDAAREHGRKRRAWIRLQREMLETERSMSIAQVAALLPAVEDATPPPEPKIVRLVRGATALAARVEALPEEDREDDYLTALRRSNEARRAGRGHLSLVPEEDDGAGV